ncbi:hypothetical protein [Nonomuraea gerenzanensis]|uniref:hypothetical protein n=1 Tax=Nonomuraea gerenzanensis TaxID=93944 RepID=UPI001CD9BB88|nr:hypothetical protein [Nonomuraea gerenzanensis]UBU16706.1 hypothetical protein LCN96_17305 [Nonomuraea gerenzanensis]
MRSIRSPYPAESQPKDEQPDQSAEQPQPATDEGETVAPVVPLRDDQPPAPTRPAAPRLDQFVEFVQGPLSDWIARERPSYLASPVTFVRERWSPPWLPGDVGALVWAWRVLLLARALLYTAFYIPAMTIFLPELTTAAIVASLILYFFA